MDFIRPKAPEGRAVVAPDLAAMAPQAFVPPQNADLLAAFADYLNAPRLAQSFWGAENPPWDVASAMAAEDAALNAEFDPNSVQPAYQPVLPVTPDRVMAEAGDPATVLPVDAGVDPATGVQYPVKPEYLRPSPPPVRDAEAERKKREDALRVGLLLPALATVTGGDLSLAMRSTPATAADALAGAQMGVDRSWKDVLDAYGLSTDYTNTENRLRAQEYEDAFNEAYRRDIQSQRAGTLALGQSKENRLGQSLKFRQSQAEKEGFNNAIAQLKSFGTDAQREALLSSPSALAAYGLTDLDPTERAALSTLSTFRPKPMSDEEKLMKVLDIQVKQWADPLISVADKPRLYGEMQQTLRALKVPGFEGPAPTRLEMKAETREGLDYKWWRAKEDLSRADERLADMRKRTALAGESLDLRRQLVNRVLSGKSDILAIETQMRLLADEIGGAKAAIGEEEAISAMINNSVLESAKRDLSSDDAATVARAKQTLADRKQYIDALKEKAERSEKLRKELNHRLFLLHQKERVKRGQVPSSNPKPRTSGDSSKEGWGTDETKNAPKKTLGGGGKAAANAGFARKPASRPKTIAPRTKPLSQMTDAELRAEKARLKSGR